MEWHERNRHYLEPTLPHNLILGNWTRYESVPEIPLLSSDEMEFALRLRLQRSKRRQAQKRVLRFAFLTSVGLALLAALFVFANL